MDARLKQCEYEEEYDVLAAAAKLEEYRKESLGGSMELPRANKLLGRMYVEVERYILAELAIKTRGIGGKTKNWLRAIPSSLAAVIAIRECIHTLSGPNQMVNAQALASQIGALWETEVRIAEAEKVNPMYMQRVREQIRDRNTTDTDHIKKVYDFAYSQIMKGELDTRLSQAECVQFGKYGLQACMDAGLVTSTRNSYGLNTVVSFSLVPEIQEFLTDYGADDVRSIMDKGQSAMRCPPDPWTNLQDGGYISPRRKLLNPLMGLRGIRAEERPRLRELFTAENMPMVFEAGNYLQSQAYTLHKPTVDALLRIWQTGGGMLGVPSKNPPTKPECPFPATWVKDQGTDEERQEFSKWKRRAILYYEDLKSWRGHVRELGGHIRLMKQYVGAPIWFPMYMDTRGRWYYRGAPNPQGSDLAKSALHFHEKKPLGRRGLFWLKVHVANSFGFDEERMRDRSEWTTHNWQHIERALDTPEDHPDVWGTDAPWCMYSAAWELREAYRSGNPETYCTGIPIHMDATCSGLQHFSALLRDPIGGTCVNLNDELGCGPKQDVYRKVSSIAMGVMQNDLRSIDPEVQEMATWWLDAGIPRGMAKKPVKTWRAINCVNSGNTQTGQS